MVVNAAQLAFLTPEWLQAKPCRKLKHGSCRAWEEDIRAGLQENPDGYLTKLSKRLSYFLRHGAEEQGLVLNEDGSVCIEDLLRHPKFKYNSADDIEIAVHTNAKQRFGMFWQGGKSMVYCRQGQSNRLGLDAFKVRGMLALAPADVPASAVHGTFTANLALIRSEGLKAMGRPIHFAVAGGHSGVRGGTDVHLHVAVRQAAHDGIPFFMSENGVLLTNGRDGVLPPMYIMGGTSCSGALLFGEIPDQSGKELRQAGAFPSTPKDTCAPAPEAVIEKPIAIVRRWRKATKQHAESTIQAASVDEVSLPEHLLPPHPPVFQEAVLQQSTLLPPHWGLDSVANSCDRPVPPRDVELAKSVVKVLRHKACDLGLSLDGDGFVTLQDLMRLNRFADASEQAIWNEANSDKARFDVKVVDGCRMLRATYKHSGARQVPPSRRA